MWERLPRRDLSSVEHQTSARRGSCSHMETCLNRWISMKAAVVPEPGKFEIRDVPAPVCPDDGVLLRVGAATICASDLKRSVRSDLPQPRPYILGEETAGTVATVGKKVTHWKVGDRGAFAARIFWGKCPPCREGHTHHCRDARGLDRKST